MHGSQWEVFAGADGLLAPKVAVASKLFGIGNHVAAKPVHELGEGRELPPGRVGGLKVAHEANADRCKIDVVVFDVAAEQLFCPSRTDLDLAVAGVDAVADDKVIGEPVLHAALAVGAVVNGGVAVFDRAVMDDDTSPIVGAHINLCGFGAYVAEQIFGRNGDGHEKLLTDPDHIARQIVGPLELADTESVDEGDAPESVAPLHDVDVAGWRGSWLGRFLSGDG